MITVKLVPYLTTIAYEISGNIYCNKTKCNLNNNGYYSINDLTWNNIFETYKQKEEFMRNGKPIDITIESLTDLGYDKCDKLT